MKRFRIIVFSYLVTFSLSAQTEVSFKCLNEEFNKLNFMIDEWSVEGTYRLNGEHVISKGKSVIKLELGGLLIEKFSGTHKDKPFKEVDLFSFRNDKFYRAKVETDHGHISLYIDKVNDKSFLLLEKEMVES
ncbi:MAG: hypothetical protein OEW87_11425 [Flavobacteriaceae bacterium]|nr:hypothetical protein [Flavobacteriaceae bacterium]